MTPSIALEVISHVRQKITNALTLIREIEQGSFPHNDTRVAIQELSNHFAAQKDELATVEESVRAQPADSELPLTITQLVNQTCRRKAEALEALIPVTGLLLRSTNIRVAFEIYGPLRRLAQKVINPKIHLVVSSEWEYSPFTYPSTVPELPNFVLIGLPASESGNGLILPAAGHELGHSLWNTRNLSNKFIPSMRDHIIARIHSTWSRFTNLFPGVEKDKLADLLNAQTWDFSIDWCESQCTELFCDFVGLLLFGRSYLQTFSYLLSPNLGGERSPNYPSMNRRARYLAQAAQSLAVDVDVSYATAFVDEEVRLADREAFLLGLVDKATEDLAKELLKEIASIKTDLNLGESNEAEERKIRSAFESLVPAQGVTSIQSIMNVAWSAKDDPTMWMTYPDLQSRKLDIINNLLLKTLEVMEYEAIIGEPDASENEHNSGPSGAAGA